MSGSQGDASDTLLSPSAASAWAWGGLGLGTGLGHTAGSTAASSTISATSRGKDATRYVSPFVSSHVLPASDHDLQAEAAQEQEDDAALLAFRVPPPIETSHDLLGMHATTADTASGSGTPRSARTPIGTKPPAAAGSGAVAPALRQASSLTDPAHIEASFKGGVTLTLQDDSGIGLGTHAHGAHIEGPHTGGRAGGSGSNGLGHNGAFDPHSKSVSDAVSSEYINSPFSTLTSLTASPLSTPNFASQQHTTSGQHSPRSPDFVYSRAPSTFREAADYEGMTAASNTGAASSGALTSDKALAGVFSSQPHQYQQSSRASSAQHSPQTYGMLLTGPSQQTGGVARASQRLPSPAPGHTYLPPISDDSPPQAALPGTGSLPSDVDATGAGGEVAYVVLPNGQVQAIPMSTLQQHLPIGQGTASGSSSAQRTPAGSQSLSPPQHYQARVQNGHGQQQQPSQQQQGYSPYDASSSQYDVPPSDNESFSLATLSTQTLPLFTPPAPQSQAQHSTHISPSIRAVSGPYQLSQPQPHQPAPLLHQSGSSRGLPLSGASYAGGSQRRDSPHLLQSNNHNLVHQSPNASPQPVSPTGSNAAIPPSQRHMANMTVEHARELVRQLSLQMAPSATTQQQQPHSQMSQHSQRDQHQAPIQHIVPSHSSSAASFNYYPHSATGEGMVALAKSQAGSRLLQTKLSQNDPVYYASVFDEVYEQLPELMVDLFGNYLCMPQSDHELLTYDGFRTFAQVSELMRTHGHVLVACPRLLDDGAYHLEYHSIFPQDVVNKTSSELVAFHSAGSRVDAVFTSDHELVGKFGDVAGALASQTTHRLTAGDILRHERNFMQPVIAASHGMEAVAGGSLLHMPFASELGLSTLDQCEAFVELYGYWLGDGSLGFSNNAAVVLFTPVKLDDVPYLDALFERLPLKLVGAGWKGHGAGGYTKTLPRVSDDSDSVDNQNELDVADVESPEPQVHSSKPPVYRISEPTWCAYFASEYAHKYAPPFAACGTDVGSIDQEQRCLQWICENSAAPELPAEAEDTESAKWLMGWCRRLDGRGARLLLRGLHFADGNQQDELDAKAALANKAEQADAGAEGAALTAREHDAWPSAECKIFTASARFRDEVIQLAMHAGTSVTIDVATAEERAAKKWWHKLDLWAVNLSFDNEAVVDLRHDVSQVEGVADVPVWCVTVPTPEHLIVVRRVTERGAHGVVRNFSRPLVVGNCQKLISFANDSQRLQLLLKVLPELLEISCDRQGTRAIQKLVESLRHPNERQLVMEWLSMPMQPGQGQGAVGLKGSAHSSPNSSPPSGPSSAPISPPAPPSHSPTYPHSALQVGGAHPPMPRLIHLIRDSNGSHVVHAILDSFPPNMLYSIHANAVHQCRSLGIDQHGLCVLKKCLSMCPLHDFVMFTKRFILEHTLEYVNNQYGNYLIQHILERTNAGSSMAAPSTSTSQSASPQQRARDDDDPARAQLPSINELLYAKLRGHFARLSRQKFSSNVVEKALKIPQTHIRTAIVAELIEADSVASLLLCSYGNYVLQNVLYVATQDECALLFARVRPEHVLNSLRKNIRMKWERLLANAHLIHPGLQNMQGGDGGALSPNGSPQGPQPLDPYQGGGGRGPEPARDGNVYPSPTAIQLITNILGANTPSSASIGYEGAGGMGGGVSSGLNTPAQLSPAIRGTNPSPMMGGSRGHYTSSSRGGGGSMSPMQHQSYKSTDRRGAGGLAPNSGSQVSSPYHAASAGPSPSFAPRSNLSHGMYGGSAGASPMHGSAGFPSQHSHQYGGGGHSYNSSPHYHSNNGDFAHQQQSHFRGNSAPPTPNFTQQYNSSQHGGFNQQQQRGGGGHPQPPMHLRHQQPPQQQQSQQHVPPPQGGNATQQSIAEQILAHQAQLQQLLAMQAQQQQQPSGSTPQYSVTILPSSTSQQSQSQTRRGSLSNPSSPAVHASPPPQTQQQQQQQHHYSNYANNY